ncbi:MAG TPA: outer membrane lipoprotein chaperone LolA [Solimonas sp.]|nr:outer membrane lipoprotein chaperone LolA [Solimonas sp.]
MTSLISRPLRFLLTCALLLGGASAHAEVASDALKRFVDGVQTLSAEFTQVQTDERGQTVANSAGRMWLQRPGRFRWDYREPYAQEMVCDGEKIWAYDPDLKQVTVRPAQEALQGTPAALLTQRTLLSDAFTLEDAGKQGGAQGVRLKPRSGDSDFKSIELWLVAGVPQRMLFQDQLGGATEIRFSAVQTGQKIDPSKFQFKPPKGVEVVDGSAR